MFPITFHEGTRRHSIFKWSMYGLYALAIILVAFAYVDVGQFSIGDNEYNIAVTRITKAIAFMVAILGLQVVIGYTGQLALGQSFFFGTGAYLTAWLVQDQNWPFLLTLVVVIPFCFLIGMLFGLPALRVKGLYLALVTLGLAAVFPSVVQTEQLADYTNGAGGKLIDADVVAPTWIPWDGIAGFLQAIPLFGGYFGDGDLSSREEDRLWKYFIIVAIAAVCFWMVKNLVRSRPGRAMRAIRDNETGAAVSGVNLAYTKTLSFGVASALGGVGGMIYVMELGIAAPLDFTQLLAINFIVGLVVGGVGTQAGAVIGGLVIAFVPDWASSTESVLLVPERWLDGPTGTLILGILLIVLTFFLPGGIAQWAMRTKARFLRVIPAEAAAMMAAAPAAAAADTDTDTERTPAESNVPGGG